MKRHYLTENNAFICNNRSYKHIGLGIWGLFSIVAAESEFANPSIGEMAILMCQVTFCHECVTCDIPNFG